MKRCPECDSVFPDGDQFCELDGILLVADEPDNQEAQQLKNIAPGAITEVPHQSDSSSKTLAILAVAGVAFGVVIFLIYYAMTHPASTENSNESSTNLSIIQPPSPLVPSSPSPDATVSPSVEPSPSPSASPSPSRQDNVTRVELSPGAVSTSGDGRTKSGRVIIRLTDGASIEADEVWQTGEGIWYRKAGVVTLLDPKNVKAFEKESGTPQPSASPSPTPK
jgi:hypothetical protein